MTNPFGPGDQNAYGQQPGPYGQQPPQPGPYGQQPYPQQPYPGGQPPYPGGPQPYPGAPMGYMPQQPRRRKKWPWIVGGIVGLVVVLGVVGYITGKDDATNAKVGDCITSGIKDAKIVDCDKSSAKFRVIGKFDDTSDVSKCDTKEMSDKGQVAAFYWKGGDKGVLCTTITKYTQLSDFDDLEGIPDDATQADLEDLRNKLAEMGIEGVK